MNILIKNIKMPTACYECPMYQADIYYCSATERDIDIPDSSMGRCSFCPLAPVPPHGRLIEESKVLDIVFEWCPDDDGSVGKDGDLREMLDEIEALPTILPATK